MQPLVDKNFSEKELEFYKLTSSSEVFCKDLKAEIFEEILEEVYKCSFDQKPDYEYIKELFNTEI